MDSNQVLDVLREAVIVMLKVGGPVMLISLVVGTVLALFQAMTQIQEQTLTFLPKLVLIMGALVMLAPFMLTTLMDFAHEISDRIIGLGMN
ncbi:MAG: flagellar biosynthesis protein FliQ [Azospirillaceae bacterium]|nr:flagellar biosynthesis protein FliQ [Azospirillaceae bacterium]